MSQKANTSPAQQAVNGNSSHAGLWAGIIAFTIWGVSPIYWNMIHNVAPLEIIAHRIVWSVVFLVPVVLYKRVWPEIMEALTTPSTAIRCFMSGALLSGNWCLYVWAVNSGHVLEISLGYYINPLLSIAVGSIFFRERPSRLQLYAIALAVLGVLAMVIGYGHMPWVGLTLGSTFLLYGIMRKTVKVNALAGFFIEMTMIAPFMLIWIVWQESHGLASFGHIAVKESLLLGFSGLLTCVPFLCFGYAARNLRLTTVGLLQYIEPTFAFILGVFIFHEHTSFTHICTFACIWVALAIYSYDSWRALRHLESKRRS